MKIDRERVVAAFREYTEKYDSSEEKIRLKIEHTYRVAGLCRQIAQALKLSEKDTELAWLSGMLHDIGRFEQLRRFGTFIDDQSIDHARYGAEILFGTEGKGEGIIRDFTEDASEDELLYTAIYHHSAYRIPEGLDERTERFCHILRDADKIDILKVNVDFPLEEIYNVSSRELRTCAVTPEVLQSFEEEHAVLRSLKKTPVDNVVGHISLVYELVYPVSVQLVKKQGYLEKLLHFESENPKTCEQFAAIREKMENYLGQRLAEAGE